MSVKVHTTVWVLQGLCVRRRCVWIILVGLGEGVVGTKYLFGFVKDAGTGVVLICVFLVFVRVGGGG